MPVVQRTGLLFISGIALIAIVNWPFGLDANLSVRILLLGILLCALFFLQLGASIKKHWKDASVLFYCAFVSLSVFSIGWSICKSEAFATANRDVLGFLTFLLALHFFKQEEKFQKQLYTVVSFLGLVTATYILYQYFFMFKNRGDLYLITGFNAHKNLVSSFAFLLCCFLVFGIHRVAGLWRYFFILVLLLNGLVIVLLQTKAVWAAAVLSVLLFVVSAFAPKKINSRSSIAIIFVMTLLLLMVFVLPNFLNHLITLGDANNKTWADQGEERLQLWRKSYQMFNAHQWFGVGSGNWQIYFPSSGLTGIWRAEDLNVTIQRPHNDFLWVLCENGLVGLIFYLIVTGIALMRAFKNGTTQGRLVGASLAGFLLISFFDFPKERVEHLVFFNLLLALACSLKSKEIEKKNQPVTVQLVLILITAFSCVVSFLRLQGEIYTRAMYDEREKNDPAKIIQNVEFARNFFFQIDSYSMPLLWYSGNAHVALNEIHEATNDFEEALRMSPYNRNILNDYASALVLENQTEKAKSYYLQAAKISPRFDDAKLNLSVIYLNEEHADTALIILKSILHDSERRNNLLKLAELKIQDQK